MHVPPHVLTHFLGNRPPNTNSVENIAVQVLLKGELKDEISLVRARPQWFAALPALSGFGLKQKRDTFRSSFLGALRADQESLSR